MIRWMVAAAGLLLAACAAPSAEARGHGLGLFGERDNFDVIQPIVVPDELKSSLPADWKNGADLVRHSETFFVVAGAWVTDKGYAIRLHGAGKYIQLDDRKIATFQAVGLLPTPMPKSDIKPATYSIGYSLWILLGIFGIFFALSPKARQNFMEQMNARYGRTPAPAPAQAGAFDWQARAMATMGQPKDAAGQPAPAAAAPAMRKAQPLNSPNPPMVEGGPRGFGKRR